MKKILMVLILVSFCLGGCVTTGGQKVGGDPGQVTAREKTSTTLDSGSSPPEADKSGNDESATAATQAEDEQDFGGTVETDPQPPINESSGRAVTAGEVVEHVVDVVSDWIIFHKLMK